MANYEVAAVETNNQRVREIIKGNQEEFLDIDILEDSIYLRARSGFTDKIMKKISKEVRDVLFKVDISFDSDRHDKTWKVRYCNGLSNPYDVELNYNITYMSVYKEMLEESKKGLFNEVDKEIEDLCRKMDTVKKLDSENFEIDRNEDKKITIEIEKEGLAIKVVKEGPSVTLESVDHISKEEDDILFEPISEINDDIPFY